MREGPRRKSGRIDTRAKYTSKYNEKTHFGYCVIRVNIPARGHTKKYTWTSREKTNFRKSVSHVTLPARGHVFYRIQLQRFFSYHLRTRDGTPYLFSLTYKEKRKSESRTDSRLVSRPPRYPSGLPRTGPGLLGVVYPASLVSRYLPGATYVGHLGVRVSLSSLLVLSLLGPYYRTIPSRLCLPDCAR